MAERAGPRRRTGQSLWLSWVLAGIVVAASLVIGVADNSADLSPGERVSAVARTIRCPQCRGQSVAESNATVAQQIRADIATRVDRGESDEQIQQAYIEQFGDASIVLNPSGQGFSSLVWIVPVIAAAAAAVALGIAFTRWRSEAEVAELASADDIAVVQAALGRSTSDEAALDHE